MPPTRRKADGVWREWYSWYPKKRTIGRIRGPAPRKIVQTER